MSVRIAIKLMIISTLAFSIMNVIVKQLSHFNAFQMVFFRSVGSLFFTFGFLVKNKISPFGNKKLLLFMRSLVGFTSMSLFFISTKYLPIGTAVSLRYMAPIFAAIFAVFLLKEKIKPVQWIFFIVAFSGVLILKGFDTELNGTGLLLIMLSAIFSGLVYIAINKIGKADHPVVIVNYFMVFSTILGGLLAMSHWIHPIGEEWLLLLSLGLFGYYGQLYMTKAFQIAYTSQVAPLKYLEVLFTLWLGVFIFGETYTIFSLLAMSLIISGLILNTKYKSKK